MPSHLRNHVIIISGRRRKDGTRAPDIILVERTGYLNFWYNGKHFYYNYVQNGMNPNNIDIDKILDEIDAQERKKKGVIVIRRRK